MIILTRLLQPPAMKNPNPIDRVAVALFDAPPLRKAMGISAILAGSMNMVDTQSGTANILLNGYQLSFLLVMIYMGLIIYSGLVLLLNKKPDPRWFIPLLSYFSINPAGYITGALFGLNSIEFGIKAISSVGLLWWLLIRRLRQGDV